MYLFMSGISAFNLSWVIFHGLSMPVHSPPSVKPVKAQAFVLRSVELYQSTVHQASSLLRRMHLFSVWSNHTSPTSIYNLFKISYIIHNPYKNSRFIHKRNVVWYESWATNFDERVYISLFHALQFVTFFRNKKYILKSEKICI